MRPSYAHLPDPTAGGTCGDCTHCVTETRPNWPGQHGDSWCRKACELARYKGIGLPIHPEGQGCKYFEWRIIDDETDQIHF